MHVSTSDRTVCSFVCRDESDFSTWAITTASITLMIKALWGDKRERTFPKLFLWSFNLDPKPQPYSKHQFRLFSRRVWGIHFNQSESGARSTQRTGFSKRQLSSNSSYKRSDARKLTNERVCNSGSSITLKGSSIAHLQEHKSETECVFCIVWRRNTENPTW